MVKILNFGSLNIDKTYKIDHIVNEGETISCKDYKQGLGGKGLNQSLALKRAGADVIHAGMVGEVDGDIFLNFLKENNIKSLVKKTCGNSGHAIIQVDKNACNSIIVEAGANKKIDKSYIDQVINEFSKGDFLLLQNEINNIPYIVKKAKEKGMKIFLNPSPIDEEIKNLDLNMIDFLILNETEGESLSGYKEPYEILNSFTNNYPKLEVILTLGEDGGIYTYKREKIKYDSYKVKAVDTTGSGDTFLGFFIGSLAKGEDIKTSLKLGALAASLSCSKEGAASSIPSKEELEEYIGKKEINIYE